MRSSFPSGLAGSPVEESNQTPRIRPMPSHRIRPRPRTTADRHPDQRPLSFAGSGSGSTTQLKQAYHAPCSRLSVSVLIWSESEETPVLVSVCNEEKMPGKFCQYGAAHLAEPGCEPHQRPRERL